MKLSDPKKYERIMYGLRLWIGRPLLLLSFPVTWLVSQTCNSNLWHDSCDPVLLILHFILIFLFVSFLYHENHKLVLKRKYGEIEPLQQENRTTDFTAKTDMKQCPNLHHSQWAIFSI